MTNQEALESVFAYCVEGCECKGESEDCCGGLVIKALEKQIAKPLTKIDIGNGVCVKSCPNCGTVSAIKYEYCPKCGQHLDWSGEK